MPKLIRLSKSLCSKGMMLLIALSVTPMLQARELAVDLDAAKTKIVFVLSDVLHTVHGTFQLRYAHISFDPASGAIAGSITVDAASGSSGSAARDKRMTRDILQAQRYPEIRFTPSKLAGSISTSGTSNLQITGSFLIHGQVHEITIPMQIQMSRQEFTAAGKFIVPYVEWGMKNPSNFLLKVSDKVEIDILAVGSTAPADR